MAGLIPVALLIGVFACALVVLMGYRAARRRGAFTPPLAPADNEPVAVTDADGEMNAAILRGRLESSGIQAYARNVSAFAYYPGTAPFGRWEVCVRYADLGAARQVLGLASGDEDGAEEA